ncbi:MAG: FAD-dependent oxidoreductase [Bacteroidales bacterium]
MFKIIKHPILSVPTEEKFTFVFLNNEIPAIKGQTIAAALHQAGFPVHSHSLKNRERSLECGIGKCGACEMLVDGHVRRICVTLVDGIHKVEPISSNKNTKEATFAQREENQEDRPARPASSAGSTSSKSSTSSAGSVSSASLDSPDSPNSVSIETSCAISATGTKTFSENKNTSNLCYHTTVVIIGAGPSGLAVREELNKYGIQNIVIDSNAKVGGQFLMQTHAFFFFEQEKRFGGMRGFDIARHLAGENQDGILLRCTVWDVLDGKKLGVKNLDNDEIFYVDCEQLVVATGALPFMPAFENDDLPGVYTAAVFQKMMNSEFTLLGKNILTIGAGNIGYLTSYQAFQAGAEVKAILEAAPVFGGFPVQRNRVQRIGIPIFTSKMLIKAIPNENHTGIIGAVVADCKDFKPIEGTEKEIRDIDVINICTGLLPDNQLLIKGKEIFGENCRGVGDAVRIGEGTSAVLRGKQCAYEILQALSVPFPYDHYLAISKMYIDSQQKPISQKQKPNLPDMLERGDKPFVILDCLYAFACNPCSFACKYGAITKTSTSTTPSIDYHKCIGCMDCVSQCPGLAIFGFQPKKNLVFLPFEYDLKEKTEVQLCDTTGSKIGRGLVDKIFIKPTKTNIARILCSPDDFPNADKLLEIRGFSVLEISEGTNSCSSNLRAQGFENRQIGTVLQRNKSKQEKKVPLNTEGKTYICHCDDVPIEEVLEQIGGRKFISIDEIKHTTHLGMGPCRGKRCIPRLKNALKAYGIEVTGDSTPRAPMSNPLQIGELVPSTEPTFHIFPKNHKEINVRAFIAGGGMAGSSLFRYMSEAKLFPLLANTARGSSWRNLAGGRPAFSVPELADIARHNMELFQNLESLRSIDFKKTRYVSFAHDQASYQALEQALSWSDAYMVPRSDFTKEISPYINPNLSQYSSAQISRNCWQATPGKTIDLLREIGKQNGGVVLENCSVISVEKTSKEYLVWIRTHYGEYVKCHCEYFVNALGSNAEKFSRMLGYQTGLYPVKHQAFITRRLPLLGLNGDSLDMLIDRQTQDGFNAIYGQQLRSTGQILLCASPAVDAMAANANIRTNSKAFLEFTAKTLLSWIPSLKGEGFQASWAGYYTEPRYIIDPKAGLFVGLRGHGFMLSMYMAKLYVDAMRSMPVPDYFHRLALDGDALRENAFK